MMSPASLRLLLLLTLPLLPCQEAKAKRHSNSSNRSSEPRLLLVISLSGLNADDLDHFSMPNLMHLRSHASYPSFFLPQYPGTSAPNLYSMATGLFPESHGVLADTVYDPKQGKILTEKDPGYFTQNPKAVPIWTLNEYHKGVSACLMWPGCDVPQAGHKPTYHVPYADSYSFTDIVDLVISFASARFVEQDYVKFVAGRATELAAVKKSAIVKNIMEERMLQQTEQSGNRTDDTTEVKAVDEGGRVATKHGSNETADKEMTKLAEEGNRKTGEKEKFAVLEQGDENMTGKKMMKVEEKDGEEEMMKVESIESMEAEEKAMAKTGEKYSKQFDSEERTENRKPHGKNLEDLVGTKDAGDTEEIQTGEQDDKKVVNNNDMAERMRLDSNESHGTEEYALGTTNNSNKTGDEQVVPAIQFVHNETVIGTRQDMDYMNNGTNIKIESGMDYINSETGVDQNMIDDITDFNDTTVDAETDMDFVNSNVAAEKDTIIVSNKTVDAEKDMNLVNSESVTTEKDMNLVNSESVTTEKDMNLVNSESVTTEKGMNLVNSESVPTEKDMNLVNSESVPTEKEMNLISNKTVAAEKDMNLVNNEFSNTQKNTDHADNESAVDQDMNTVEDRSRRSPKDLRQLHKRGKRFDSWLQQYLDPNWKDRYTSETEEKYKVVSITTEDINDKIKHIIDALDKTVHNDESPFISKTSDEAVNRPDAVKENTTWHPYPFFKNLARSKVMYTLEPSARANLVMVRFDEPAKTATRHGLHSSQMMAALHTLDTGLLYLHLQLQQHKLQHQTDVILVSDHGSTVLGLNPSSKYHSKYPSKTREEASTKDEAYYRKYSINLDGVLSPSLYTVSGETPLLHIWPEAGKEEEVYDLLKNASTKNHFTVYDSQHPAYDAYHFSDNPRISKILLKADPGYGFSDVSNERALAGSWDRYASKGMPLMLAAGPSFKENYQGYSMHTVDIYPLIMEVLNIHDGPPMNGSFVRPSFLLKTLPALIYNTTWVFVFLAAIIMLILLALVLSCCACHKKKRPASPAGQRMSTIYRSTIEPTNSYLEYDVRVVQSPRPNRSRSAPGDTVDGGRPSLNPARLGKVKKALAPAIPFKIGEAGERSENDERTQLLQKKDSVGIGK